MYHIINKFCVATGAKLNVQKSKIMGYGKWANKESWSADWLVAENISLKCLGITIYKNWDITVRENWNLIEIKIRNHLNSIMSRQLTLFQKSIYIKR